MSGPLPPNRIITGFTQDKRAIIAPVIDLPEGSLSIKMQSASIAGGNLEPIMTKFIKYCFESIFNVSYSGGSTIQPFVCDWLGTTFSIKVTVISDIIGNNSTLIVKYEFCMNPDGTGVFATLIGKAYFDTQSLNRMLTTKQGARLYLNEISYNDNSFPNNEYFKFIQTPVVKISLVSQGSGGFSCGDLDSSIVINISNNITSDIEDQSTANLLKSILQGSITLYHTNHTYDIYGKLIAISFAYSNTSNNITIDMTVTSDETGCACNVVVAGPNIINGTQTIFSASSTGPAQDDLFNLKFNNNNNTYGGWAYTGGAINNQSTVTFG